MSLVDVRLPDTLAFERKHLNIRDTKGTRGQGDGADYCEYTGGVCKHNRLKYLSKKLADKEMRQVGALFLHSPRGVLAADGLLSTSDAFSLSIPSDGEWGHNKCRASQAVVVTTARFTAGSPIRVAWILHVANIPPTRLLP